jgi:hypothetical protein
MSYFTPEKEDHSSRFRESTPKTPKTHLFRKKKDTPEKEVPSSRFTESTPKTPLEKKEIEIIFEKEWNEVERSRGLVNDHIDQAKREQKKVLINIKIAKNTAEQYDKKMEFDELTVLLETETQKYVILKSLIKKKSTKSQIIVPYGLF